MTKRIPSGLKGVVGLVVLLGVIAGAMFLLVRYENDARTKTPQASSSTAPTSQPSTQCYNLTNSTYFNSGNPRKDAVFAKVMKDNKGTPELQTFLADHQKNKAVNEKSPLWEKADAATPSAVPLKPYLRISTDGTLELVEGEEPSKYMEGSLATPEALPASFVYVKIMMLSSKTKQTTNETREYVIAMNSNDSRHMVVFPVEKSDNVERDGFTVLQVAPVC